MRRMVLIGRSECGKTTLKQALRGEKITYHKTQYVSQYDCLIDMPGEYAENIDLAHAIALYIAEADVVGIVLSATEPYSETIGIVTKIDHWCANPQQAAEWLRLTGCEHIFFTSSYTGEGIEEIHDFLKVEHEICTVDMVSSRIQEETFEKPAKLYDYHLL